MTTRRARRGWMVRLGITRRGGWRAWAAISGDFERDLAALASKTIIKPRIDAESRRGRDYVRVTLAMTVAATDVAEALATAWQAFRQAAGGDTRGWDMTSATADVRPREKSLSRTGSWFLSAVMFPPGRSVRRWRRDRAAAH